MGIALVVLLAVQILLGGVTVLLKLPHLISTAHLVNALLILAGLLVLCSSSRGAAELPQARARRGEDQSSSSRGAAELPHTIRASAGDGKADGMARVRRLAMTGLAVLLIQLALGGYVRHSGAGLACPDFPLCAGSPFPGHALGLVHWVHRWLGVALLGFFVHLAMAGRRTPLAPAASAVGTLALAQVALGMLTVLLGLDPVVRAAHAAMGYVLWGTLVWLSARAGAWRWLLRAPARGRACLAVAHAP